MKNYQDINFQDLKTKILYSDNQYQTFIDYLEIESTSELEFLFESSDQKDNFAFLIQAVSLVFSKEIKNLNNEILKLKAILRGDSDYP